MKTLTKLCSPGLALADGEILDTIITVVPVFCVGLNERKYEFPLKLMLNRRSSVTAGLAGRIAVLNGDNQGPEFGNISSLSA